MTDQQLFAPLQDLSRALVSLVAAAAPAVVSVHSHRSRSSGFVWRPGLIVTADEALADEGDVAIALRDGTTVAAKIAGRDPTTQGRVFVLTAVPGFALLGPTDFILARITPASIWR